MIDAELEETRTESDTGPAIQEQLLGQSQSDTEDDRLLRMNDSDVIEEDDETPIVVRRMREVYEMNETDHVVDDTVDRRMGESYEMNESDQVVDDTLVLGSDSGESDLSEDAEMHEIKSPYDMTIDDDVASDNEAAIQLIEQTGEDEDSSSDKSDIQETDSVKSALVMPALSESDEGEESDNEMVIHPVKIDHLRIEETEQAQDQDEEQVVEKAAEQVEEQVVEKSAEQVAENTDQAKARYIRYHIKSAIYTIYIIESRDYIIHS